ASTSRLVSSKIMSNNFVESFFQLGSLKAGLAFFHKSFIGSISDSDKKRPHRNIDFANANSNDSCSFFEIESADVNKEADVDVLTDASSSLSS
ncbi:23910_t:CDS:1, partial [Dentiscutata erythropus]